MYHEQVEATMMNMSRMAAEACDQQVQNDLMGLMSTTESIRDNLARINTEFDALGIKSADDVGKMTLTFTGDDALLVLRALTTTLAGIRAMRLMAAEQLMASMVEAHQTMSAISCGAKQPRSMEEILAS